MENKNIKLNFVIICDSAIISKENNSLYILGIFDKIIAQQLPAIHPKFDVVVNASGNPGEYNLEIVIKHKETQEIVVKMVRKLNIISIERKSQFIGTFINTKFPRFGEYIVEIIINGEVQELFSNFILEQANGR